MYLIKYIFKKNSKILRLFNFYTNKTKNTTIDYVNNEYTVMLLLLKLTVFFF